MRRNVKWNVNHSLLVTSCSKMYTVPKQVKGTLWKHIRPQGGAQTGGWSMVLIPSSSGNCQKEHTAHCTSVGWQWVQGYYADTLWLSGGHCLACRGLCIPPQTMTDPPPNQSRWTMLHCHTYIVMNSNGQKKCVLWHYWHLTCILLVCSTSLQYDQRTCYNHSSGVIIKTRQVYICVKLCSSSI